MQYAQIDRIVLAALEAKDASKTCGKCSRHFQKVPESARFFVDPDLGGYYWECECRSTLFVPCPSEEECAA